MRVVRARVPHICYQSPCAHPQGPQINKGQEACIQSFRDFEGRWRTVYLHHPECAQVYTGALVNAGVGGPRLAGSFGARNG